MLGLFLEMLALVLRILVSWFDAALRTCLPFLLRRKDVSGKIVLVTGAGSGIGALMARRFASLGAKVVLWDVNPSGNADTAAKIRAAGGVAFPYTIDLCDADRLEDTARRVEAEIGLVDILVNNAGIVCGKLIMDTPPASSAKVMKVNADAVMWTTREFLAGMMRRNAGHVVIIASSAGLFGLRKLADYCASKHAAVGFAESLAVELHGEGKDGVKVTTVCPYIISTGLFAGAASRFPGLLPVLTPEYVADLVVDAVLTETDFVLAPRIMWCLYIIKPLLPTKAMRALSDFLGGTDLMDSFVGREGKTE